MLVSDAKKKVCPFVQHVVPANSGASLGECNQFSSANINCICGDCMAWTYTKKVREMTANEKDMQKRYEEDKNKRLNYFYHLTYIFSEQSSLELLKNIHKDILNLDLELEEDKKEGICMRLSK